MTKLERALLLVILGSVVFQLHYARLRLNMIQHDIQQIQLYQGENDYCRENPTNDDYIRLR